MRPRLRRLEWMLAVFQSLLVLALLGTWNDPGAPRGLLVPLLGTLVLLFACRSARPRHPWGEAFCEWGYLYPFIVASYLATGRLIPFYREVGSAHDEMLAGLDGVLFGVTPGGWGSWIAIPAVVEISFIGYMSYFLFGLLLVASLQRRYGLSSRVFRASFSAAVITFYVSYLGYWLFPAQGPRLLWAGSWEPLRGLALAGPALSRIEGVLPNFHDAFPSEHVMLSIVAGYFWFRYERRMFRIMAPFLALAVAATVVLRYHWVTDVAAGAVLAPFVIGASEKWGEWMAGTPDEQKN